MIIGAHVIVYSTAAEADRAFLLELLGTRHVDAGGGWLIVALPPAEIAVHPTDGEPKQELHLMCDDIDKTVVGPRGARSDLRRRCARSGLGAVDVNSAAERRNSRTLPTATSDRGRCDQVTHQLAWR